jgi:hypothetical protein
LRRATRYSSLRRLGALASFLGFVVILGTVSVRVPSTPRLSLLMDRTPSSQPPDRLSTAAGWGCLSRMVGDGLLTGRTGDEGETRGQRAAATPPIFSILETAMSCRARTGFGARGMAEQGRLSTGWLRPSLFSCGLFDSVEAGCRIPNSGCRGSSRRTSCHRPPASVSCRCPPQFHPSH